jgi:beta-glucanase (GH16 family)
MKQIIFAGLYSFIFIGPLLAQKPLVKVVQEDVIFFDDFSSKTLDRSKWNVVITGFHVNNEQQAYVDSSLTIHMATGKEADGAKNGALVLHPRYAPNFVTFDGKKFDFISGRIDTRNKVEFNHGLVEARIKLTEGSGLWPAFWLLGGGRWPETGEIDIMEYVGEKDWISAALHGPGYSGETPLVNKFFFMPTTDVTQWHVYSVDWTTDSLLFKVDGQLYYRATIPMIEHYGKWSFDNNKYLILNFALGGAYPFKTNGIKEPYNGMTEASIQSVKEGKSKMLVDWVRVSRR